MEQILKLMLQIFNGSKSALMDRYYVGGRRVSSSISTIWLHKLAWEQAYFGDGIGKVGQVIKSF